MQQQDQHQAQQQLLLNQLMGALGNPETPPYLSLKKYLSPPLFNLLPLPYLSLKKYLLPLLYLSMKKYLCPHLFKIFLEIWKILNLSQKLMRITKDLEIPLQTHPPLRGQEWTHLLWNLTSPSYPLLLLLRWLSFSHLPQHPCPSHPLLLGICLFLQRKTFALTTSPHPHHH